VKHWLGFGFLLSVGLFMAAVLGASPVRQLGNRHCRSRHVVLTAAFAAVAVGLLTLSVTYPLRIPSPSQIGNLLSIASISASVVSEQPTPKKDAGASRNRNSVNAKAAIRSSRRTA
jgi:hypothetical protein